MGVEMTAEAKARVAKHLDAVEAALAGKGISRDERRAVVDDLEAQIREMVETGGKGDVAAVEAVLAKLDRPEAYGAERVTVKSAGKQVRRGVSAAGIAAVILGMAAVVMVIPPLWSLLWTTGAVVALFGLGFGIVGVVQRRARRGMGAAGLALNGAALAWVGVMIVAWLTAGGRPAGREVSAADFWAEVDAHKMVRVEVYADGEIEGEEAGTRERLKTRMPASALDATGFKILSERCSAGGATLMYRRR